MNGRNNQESISYLAKLNSDKDDWVIKVPISRSWDVFDMNNQTDLLSTETVLIDEQIVFTV